MSSLNVSIFTKDNFDQIVWPNNSDADYLKNYFTPLLRDGTQKYIENVDADVFIIKLGDKVLPGVVSKNLNDCYVASPFAHYITYTKYELFSLNKIFGGFIAITIINLLGLIFKLTNFNRSVYVNNWLLSTNLYVDLSDNEVSAINSKLKEKFPQYTIIYRSLNSKTDYKLMKRLDSLKAKKILSRQVYITDPSHPEYKNHKDFRNDQKFLKQSNLKIQSDNFSDSNINEIRTLYNQLYIEKYSKLNPQFTHEFFFNAAKNNLFNFRLLKNDQTSKAILGYFERNGTMTTPIFGFDTNAPQREGLYRVLSLLLVQESEKRNLILNQSSGAANFKRQRGAKPFIEYNYYFNQHCSIKQKFAWFLLGFILNSFGTYLFKRFKL